MQQSKKQQYEEFVRKYEKVYGSLPAGDKSILFNVTGPLRNEYYKEENEPENLFMFVILSVTMMNISAISIMYTILSTNLVSAAVFISIIAVYIHRLSIIYGVKKRINAKKMKVFDGEFIMLKGRKIGIVFPTQEEERELEERNFKQTNDLHKLMAALERAKLPANKNMCVISVGSTTAQCIYGDTTKPEIEVGIDNPAKIDELLESVPLGIDDVLVIMNSACYGVNEDAGIVYNDNVMEYDTITGNIVERTVGGTGNNAAAMDFIRKLTRMHKSLDKNYVLAVVPRGDKTMPQGGSHSKQRILEAIDEQLDIIVVEVSGKQTKQFDLVNANIALSTEEICKNIKETKIVTAEGKTYGSGAFVHLS
jgi:hypothetical protein